MAEKIKLGSNGNFGVKEGGVLGFNDENGVFKAIELASSRASGATYVAESGLIADAEVGVPRIDWTNGVGELLLEPQSTNKALRSEEFDSASWVATRCTISGDSVTSPDGTTNADLLTSTDTAENYVASNLSISVSGSKQTFSCFVKKGTSDFTHLLLWDTVANGARQWFDLTNGVVGGSTTFGTGVSVDSASIVDFGNGWYRCIVTFNNSNTTIRVRVSASDADQNIASQVGKTIYIYGAQLEELSYPTSYIRTNGSAVTRIADAVTGNSSLGQVINSSEGVLYFEGSGFQDIPSGNLYFSICDGSNANSIFFRLSNVGALIAYNSGLTSPNNIIAQLSAGSIDLESNFKISIRWGSTSDDFQLFVNGSKVTQQVGFVFSPLSGLNKLIFALFDGSGDFYGRIREVKVYDTALTDAELQTLTTL